MQRRPCALLIMSARIVLAGVISTGLAVADVVLDGSFGSSEVIAPGVDRFGNGATFLISEDVGKRVGSSLLFSFSDLDVGVGQTATFDGATPTRVVIARVTSGVASRIDGSLDSTLSDADGGADLFLINPAGVIFGEGARLGPGFSGSFYASTADELHLEDGTVLAMGLAGDSLLTSAPPMAFGFLSDQPAPISLQGAQLAVQTGKTLALIGGDIDISGFFFLPNLKATSGRIELASLAGPGVVPFLPDLASFDITSLAPGSLGSIELTDRALLDVSGFVDGMGILDGPGGSLVIRTGRFEIRDGIIQAANFASTDSPARAVDIQAGREVVIRSTTIDAGAVLEGAAGDVSIEASDIELVAGRILSTAQSSGAGGSIELRANDALVIRGAAEVTTKTTSQDIDAAAGGDIALSGATVEIRDAGLVSASTSGPGAGGSVSIDAGVLQIHTGLDDTGADATLPGLLEVKTTGAGAGGNLSVVADAVELIDGGQLSLSTDGAGAAGELMVDAQERVAIEGLSRVPVDTGTGQLVLAPSGIFNRSLTNAVGPGGELIIETGLLTVENGAEVSARTFGAGDAGNLTIDADRVLVAGGANGASLLSVRAAEGDGGRLSLDVRELELRSGGQIVAEAPISGTSGDIRISAQTISIRGSDPLGNPSVISTRGFGGDAGTIFVAADTLTLEDGGQISATAVSTGASGDIEIIAGDLRLDGGAEISVESLGATDAGTIRIRTDTSVRLAGGSSITTEALTADGGDITIRHGDLLDLRDSAITATVDGQQATTGGNIDIRGDNVVVTSSRIIAKANVGTGGKITIEAAGLFVDDQSEISAASRFGVSGTVELDSPAIDLVGNFAQLSESFLDVSGLLAEQCTAVTAPQGSLVVRQRIPLRSTPDEPLQSFYLGD